MKISEDFEITLFTFYMPMCLFAILIPRGTLSILPMYLSLDHGNAALLESAEVVSLFLFFSHKTNSFSCLVMTCKAYIFTQHDKYYPIKARRKTSQKMHRSQIISGERRISCTFHFALYNNEQMSTLYKRALTVVCCFKFAGV